MKHTKQLIMILIIVFLLVGLGTLAAVDVTKNDTSTTKNTEKNTKISTENNIKDTTNTPTTQTPITKEKQIQKTQKLNTKKEPTPINITTYDELRDALKDGTEPTKILNITQNITLEDSPTLTGSITNLIINGNQKTINGNGTYQFLTIKSGQTVTINNITITNCASEEEGGAIYNNLGTLNINNSNLTQNNATRGGAIYNYKGTLNINNSNLTQNNATRGGAIHNNEGTLNISNSNLTQNTANTGGAIYNYNYGTLNINNSNLNYNTATGTEIYNGGGAIYNNNTGTLTINNSNLTQNNARLGGAINNNGTLNITNSNLTQNTANTGGAIYNIGTLNITNSNLTQNTANNGGAILNYHGTLYINNSNLNYNNATKYEGGAIYNTGTLNISNSNLTQNTANSQGGAIYYSGGTLNITNSNLNYNNATYGGAICSYGTLNINNSNLTQNNANTGGAILNGNKGTLNIYNSNLNYNNATEYGGAILNGNKGTLNIYNSNLNYNNATEYGGAIRNNGGTLNISNSNLTQNTANTGGAIRNYGTLNITNSNLHYNNATQNGGAIYNNGTLNITNSNLNYNTATQNGGAIHDLTERSSDNVVTLYCSNFTENKAVNGAVINNEGGYGKYNITDNTFKNNKATEDKETLNLGPINNRERTVEENTYDNTDINLKTVKLTTPDGETTYQYDDDIILNYTIQLTNPEYYDEDILNKTYKTLYIDNIENNTTEEKNLTISQLKPGKHTLYYKTCNSQSNNLTLTVIGDSEITTDQKTYNHIDGIKNKITLNIIDPSEEKGSITITVKDQDKYTELSTYSNVVNGYQLSTDALVESLENIYDTLNQSYVINVTYSSEYTNPNSTEFTLNIIKKRNTTITYNILNNTEGNLEINIMVLDAIYKTPIPDAQTEITGAINKQTTAGKITDNTLTPGDYNITVNFNETDDYYQSNTTIKFTVEIDKDRKIAELENNITNLTQEIKNAQEEIQNLTETNKQYKELIDTTLKTIEDLNQTINNLTQQLENAQQEIQDLNKTITELNKTMNTTINIKPVTSSVGSQLKLTATITDTAGNKVTTGKVLFKVNGITLKDANGNVIYAIVNNGEATLTTKTQAAWIKNTTNIQAVYSGEKPYKSSRANTTNITITKGKATITLEEKTITAKAGQTITLKAKVLDSNGDRINNDKVVFKLNGRTLTDKDGKTLYARVVDGEAVLEYTIPETYNAKTYNLTAVFGGNYYERTQTQGTFILEKKATTITQENITTTNGKTTIKATITDETGKTLITSTKIVIKINGKTITTTNSTNGTIDTSFTTTLKPGTYELTIISGENGQYKKATMTTSLKI